MIIFLYVVFTICIMILANRSNRSVIGHTFLSIILSPLIAFIILICLGDKVVKK